MVRNTTHELYGVRISGEVYSLLRDLRDNCPRNLGSVDIDVAISLITCKRRDFLTSYDQLNEIVVLLSKVCGDSRRFVATKIMNYYAANFPSKVESIQSYIAYMPTDNLDVKHQPTDDQGTDKTQPPSTSLITGIIKEEDDDSDDLDSEITLKESAATSTGIGKRGRLSKTSAKGNKLSRAQSSDVGSLKLSALLSSLIGKPIKRAQLEARKEYTRQIDESRACYGRPVKYDLEIQDLAIHAMEHELLTIFSYLQKPIVAHSPSERRHFFIPGNTYPFCSTSLPIVYPPLGTIMAAPADFLCRPRLPGRKITRDMSKKISPNEVSSYIYDSHLLDYTRHNDTDDPSDLKVELRSAWAQTIGFSKATYDLPGELMWQYPMYKLITQKPVPEHHSLIDLTGCYVTADALFDSLTTELIELARNVIRYAQKRRRLALRQRAAKRKWSVSLPSIFNESFLSKESFSPINDAIGADDILGSHSDLPPSPIIADNLSETNTDDETDDSESTSQPLRIVILNLLERLQKIVFFPPFRVCVDQRHLGNVSRYVRFVESPFDATCYIKAVGVSGSTRLQLHAAKDLPANAELTLHAGSFCWIKHDSELMRYLYTLEDYLLFTDQLTIGRPWRSLLQGSPSDTAESTPTTVDSAMLVTLAELRLRESAASLLSSKQIDLDFIKWLSDQLYDVSYIESSSITDLSQLHISLINTIDPANATINTTNNRCNVLVNPKNFFTHSSHSHSCSLNIVTADTNFSMNGYYLYHFFLTHKLLVDRASLDSLASSLLLTDKEQLSLLTTLIGAQLTAIYTDLDGGTSSVAKGFQTTSLVLAPPLNDSLTQNTLPLTIRALKHEARCINIDSCLNNKSSTWHSSVCVFIIRPDGTIDNAEFIFVEKLQTYLLAIQKKNPTYNCYEISLDHYIMHIIKGYIETTTVESSVVMKTFPTYYSAWTPFVPISEVQSLTFDPLLTRIFFTIAKCYKNYKILPDLATVMNVPLSIPYSSTSAVATASTVDKVLLQGAAPYSFIPTALDEQIDALLLRLIHHNTYFNLISYGMGISKHKYVDMIRQLISSPLHFSLADAWSHPLELFDIAALPNALSSLATYVLRSQTSDIQFLQSTLLELKDCNREHNYKSYILVQEASIFSDTVLYMLATDILALLHSMPPLSGKNKQSKSKRNIIQKEALWPGSKEYAPPGYNGLYAKVAPQMTHSYLAPDEYLKKHGDGTNNTSFTPKAIQVSKRFSSPVIQRIFADARATFQSKVKA
ncbi:putative methyl transferase [Giardia duodenalis assemblage B]|uniref:Putative methyl transferase n=1 Tax=Giardia duodenalis assemblage B TaxID=1394984 RepID=A0A132NN44_GIAIN|nr:putative methyl transferase [Giardia intestinalis assemblage B]